jgi:glycosyltransferase involved in cell wall biosynthesis
MIPQALESGISVVVPVYNSMGSLPKLAAKLEPVLAGTGGRFELILINDDSRDKSWDVITNLAHQYSWVRGFNLMRNYGQHNALLCGIRAAKFDIIVTIDDDLQHSPEDIPKLIQKLDEGFEVVYGTPQQEQHGLGRDLASKITKIVLQSAMGAATARHVSAFRVFRTHLRLAFSDYRSPYLSIDVLLTWGTTRFTAVPVKHEPRTIGTSNYTLKKLILHALNMMTGFSTLPLRGASISGLGFALFGMLVLIYVLVRYALTTAPVPGFAFLACTIAIFSGVQLFALGVMGEYLARIHLRLMERPTYTVTQTTENGIDVLRPPTGGEVMSIATPMATPAHPL